MECRTEARKHPTSPIPKLILVGNPNVGKSVIFNYLTGKYVTVSNYPGTTVEVASGSMKRGRKRLQVIDTPGVNSLIPMSEDEKVTRDILLNEPQKVLVQVADAKNLRRGLLLSLQLMEMGLPFTLILNMWDEAKSRGIVIPTKRLSEVLGVPILTAVATRRKGLEKICDHVDQPPPPAANPVAYPEAIEEGIARMVPLLPEATLSKRSLALMLLSGDESLSSWLHESLSAETIEKIEGIRQDVESRFAEPIGYLVTQTRLRRVDELLSRIGAVAGASTASLATLLGNLSIHPFWGLPILLFVLFITYEFVGVFGAQLSVRFLEETFFGKWILPPIQAGIEAIVRNRFFQGFLIGPYGVFTMALTYALAIVFPIVGCFFLIFGLMEDSGYLPRLAVMSNRIFKKMGLNGKAVLPMVLGLGCDTMATMTTRILETEKDRTIVTFLLALGVPCSAQLGVILGLFSNLPLAYLVVWIGLIAAVLFAVGRLAARILPGPSSDFILELPPLRVPQVSNIVVKTLARIEWYLKEAVPLFVLGTALLFLLHESRLLDLLERAATPLIVSFLGLPAKATEAFMIGFLRRDYGAAGLFMLAKEGQLDAHQILVSLVTITLFIPCIAQFFMMIKERGLWKALWMTALIFPLAFGVGGALHWVMSSLGV